MCNDGKALIPFHSEPYFSTVESDVFYPVSEWMPACTTLRAALRLLAEQGDGLV